MKIKITLLLLFSYSSLTFAQQLGFSTLSSYSSESIQSDHVLYSSAGESVISPLQSDLSLCNGVMENLAQNQYSQNTILVKFYLDENENGLKDNDELFIKLGACSINSNLTFANHSSDGIIIKAPDDNYVISYFDLKAPGDWFLTSSDDISVDIDDQNSFAEVHFGMSPEDQYKNTNSYLSSGRFRCFSKVDYELTLTNEGTIRDQGIVWLHLDERIEEIFFTSPPDYVQTDHIVGWDYDLGPTETVTIGFCLTAPSVSDEVPPGTIFKSTTWVDGFRIQYQFCYEQELRCSWDPNDKLVNPNRPDSLGLLDRPIVYTLRFQNTGNDYAENVVVTDTISDNLDMSTFKVLNTSHPDLLQVEIDRANPNIVNFRFDNIFLPDSTTNEPGSNGLVMYSIRPVDGLSIGTEINNTGFIYFDFNPAVVTNTTSTTLVDAFPISAVEDEDKNSLDISVFPNPSKGLIYFDKTVDLVKVINVYGQEVFLQQDVCGTSL